MFDLDRLYSEFLNSSGVCTDSRNIKKNQIFFALKGERFDGNSYASDVLNKGAKLAVVDDKSLDKSDAFFFVNDALIALQELAKYHRNKLRIPVIGLTGSNGKTTTKELIHSVLNQKFNVCFTQGNLNNHIGVPLTILSIQNYHEMAVIEMGANHQKEIKFLSSICQPDFGYITNFGKAHLEGFGGVEGVIKGKSELYTYLKNNNKTVLINLDDKLQVENSIGIEQKITFSSTSSDANFFFSKDKDDNNFVHASFEVLLIKSHLMGEYNFSNICAAISLGKYFGLSNNQIKSGIESYTPNNNRSQIFEKRNGQKIILDAYNANPNSMSAAINNLNDLTGDKLAILGDMFELGDAAAEEHKAILDLLCVKKSLDAFLIGTIFFSLASDYKKDGLYFFENIEDCFSYIKEKTPKQKNILIKGSRGMKLEVLQSEICKED